MGELLDKAICFATNAHNGTFRKGTDIPYILHPLEAATIVATMTCDEEVISAAVLHDVVEDTKYNVDDIKNEFGSKVAHLVGGMSENKRDGIPEKDTWRIRKIETIEELNACTDKELKMIALGDKLSNIRAMYRDQLKLGDQLWERFNVKDKSEHMWYYQSVCDALKKELSGYIAWQELRDTINKVKNNE